MFRKYHYLNHKLRIGSDSYILTINNILCGFISIISFPHPKVKNFKKVHRLVILPDYQGLGLGSILLEKVAQYYNKYRFCITTSAPSLIFSLKKNKNWRLFFKGRMLKQTGLVKMQKTGSSNRLTTSWEYIK